MGFVEIVQHAIPDIASSDQRESTTSAVRKIHTLQDAKHRGHAQARVANGDERDRSRAEQEAVWDGGEVLAAQVGRLVRRSDKIDVFEQLVWRDGEESVRVDEEAGLVLWRRRCLLVLVARLLGNM